MPLFLTHQSHTDQYILGLELEAFFHSLHLITGKHIYVNKAQRVFICMFRPIYIYNIILLNTT
jgi:hypothetical protein